MNDSSSRDRIPLDVSVTLPEWAATMASEMSTEAVRDDDARMAFVLELARRNVREASGGPFAAAVFERRRGRLIAIGVNRVVPERCSVAHAEMLAIMASQQRAATHDLSTVEGGCELVTSTEPCAMCLGAIPWSGVSRIVCGARDADARAIGFDEGAKPDDWVGALRTRGIEVIRDVRREEAVAVLQAYADDGGELYNAGGR